MIRATVTIINKLGLHARASAKLNKLASEFSCRITLEKDGRKADAKNIMSLMMLAASKGTDVIVETDGEDEQAAFDAVSGLINNFFEEGE